MGIGHVEVPDIDLARLVAQGQDLVFAVHGESNVPDLTLLPPATQIQPVRSCAVSRLDRT